MVYIEAPDRELTHPSYGVFTLHGTGTGTGTGDGNRINGFLYIMFTVHTAPRQGQEPDP